MHSLDVIPEIETDYANAYYRDITEQKRIEEEIRRGTGHTVNALRS